MFFIFGSPRSGTTLLAQSLSQHEEIFIPDETDFIVPVAFVYDRIKNPEVGKALIAEIICNSSQYQASVGQYLSADKVAEIVARSSYTLYDILGNIYQEMAVINGARIGGDKSPNDLGNFYMLVKGDVLARDNKIIHIVRDPRDVMLSLLKLGWAANDDSNFPRVWANINQNLYELFRDQPERYMLVKYEEFVCDYTSHLKKLTAFLGVDYQERMSDHTLRHPRYKAMQHHQKLFTPVTVDGIGAYKKEVSREVMEKWQRKAVEGLQAFQYSLC